MSLDFSFSRSRTAKAAIAGLVLASAPGIACGDILNVPSEYATIQAAIDAAFNGDEVVVAAGTYAELINFNGKQITLRSADPFNAQVVAATIIHGGGSGPVVRCISGETAAAVLDGLTITGGVGSGNGGGMHILSASPTLSRCVFRGNKGTVGGAASEGGALHIQGGTPTVNQCQFLANRAVGSGGAVRLTSEVTFNGCIFRGNHSDGNGGAVHVAAQFNFSAFNDCLFAGNTATFAGGAVFPATSGFVAFTNCQFIGNATCASNGGALVCNPGTQLNNSTFCRNMPDDLLQPAACVGSGNTFDNGCPAMTWNVPADASTIQDAIDLAANGDEIVVAPGTYLEAIEFPSKVLVVRSSGGPAVTTIDAARTSRAVTVDRCLADMTLDGFTITGGTSSGNGGGMYVGNATAHALNCAFIGNTAGGAEGGGGIYADTGAQVTITDTSFCQNVPDAFSGVELFTLNGLVFLSENEECLPLARVGACCIGETAIEIAQWQCAAVGGEFFGVGVPANSVRCAPACVSDIAPPGGDGAVSVSDLLKIINDWGVCP